MSYPKIRKEYGSWLSMDTQPQREGLHVWISRDIPDNEGGVAETESISIYLTRDDARDLVADINRRLF
jgi:hypothetical protein